MSPTAPLLLIFSLACRGEKGGDSYDDSGCSGCDNYDDDPADVREDPQDIDTLIEHVAYLASEELAGRAPGSEGDALAIDYIERAFLAYGLAAPAGGHRQDFVDSEGTPTQNVAAVLWGSDSSVADEIILLTAHHDHLGVGRNGAIFRGANDDASGVAGLLSIADELSRAAPLRRTVVFLATGSEEVNLDGAAAWAEDPPAELPLADTAFVLNLDMIGSYDYEELVYALDVEPGTPGRSALDAALGGFADLEVNTRYESSLSDLDAFCDAELPGMMFYTDDEAYHSPEDVPEQLDYPRLSQIARLAGDVLQELGDGEHGLAEYRARGCTKW